MFVVARLNESCAPAVGRIIRRYQLPLLKAVFCSWKSSAHNHEEDDFVQVGLLVGRAITAWADGRERHHLLASCVRCLNAWRSHVKDVNRIRSHSTDASHIISRWKIHTRNKRHLRRIASYMIKHRSGSRQQMFFFEWRRSITLRNNTTRQIMQSINLSNGVLLKTVLRCWNSALDIQYPNRHVLKIWFKQKLKQKLYGVLHAWRRVSARQQEDLRKQRLDNYFVLGRLFYLWRSVITKAQSWSIKNSHELPKDFTPMILPQHEAKKQSKRILHVGKENLIREKQELRMQLNSVRCRLQMLKDK